jgi:hypothetical protein
MSSTMQAVVKAKAAPGIELREVPVPSPRPAFAERTCISSTGIRGHREGFIRR